MQDEITSSAARDGARTDLLAAEKSKLRRNFGRLDIFFFLVCTLVGVDGLGQLTTKGGAAFTWMVGSVILFAIPSALLLAELGAAFSEEGGPYVWVRMAFGLRRRRPDERRPFRAPMIGLLTLMSTALVVFCTIESLLPGLGGGWFDAANLPGPQWHPDERWTYLAGAGGPLLVFLLIGAASWAIGTRQARSAAPSAEDSSKPPSRA